MSESADSLVGAVLEDRYRVLRKIGEGGMGAVYEAEHLRIGRRMAVKTLQGDYAKHSDLVTRFEREAFAAAAVGNEHIIDVTDSGKLPDGGPFLVFELLSGVELWCWGSERFGRLGNRRLSDTVSPPVRVDPSRRFTAVDATGSHVCGIDCVGAARCWGLNGDGEHAVLGYAGFPEFVLEPEPICAP